MSEWVPDGGQIITVQYNGDLGALTPIWAAAGTRRRVNFRGFPFWWKMSGAGLNPSVGFTDPIAGKPNTYAGLLWDDMVAGVDNMGARRVRLLVGGYADRIHLANASVTSPTHVGIASVKQVLYVIPGTIGVLRALETDVLPINSCVIGTAFEGEAGFTNNSFPTEMTIAGGCRGCLAQPSQKVT